MMIDIKSIREAASAASPVDTDLLGDRYFDGGYSTTTLTKEQDDFIVKTNPSTVIAMCDEIEQLRKDAIRLDFYAENTHRVAVVAQTWYHRKGHGHMYRSAPSLRDAIDRAMETTE
jgi:hypothetical protein